MAGIDDIISNQYDLIKSGQLNFSQKSEIYYSIIFIKNGEGIADIYVDIKNFLVNYIQSFEERNFGYDSINSNKINTCVALLGYERRIAIYQFLKKLLYKHHYEEDWKLFKYNLYESKNNLITAHRWWFINPQKLILFIYNKSVYSYPFLALIVALFIFMQYVLLLPNPWQFWPSLFRIKYQDISDTFWINHLGNVLLNFFEVDSECKITPLNFVGILLLIVGRLIKILFIVKYVADKILKQFNWND